MKRLTEEVMWQSWVRESNQTKKRDVGLTMGKGGAELLGTIQLERWVWHRGWAGTQAFQGAGPVPSLQAPSLSVALHSTDGWKPVAGSLPDFCFSPTSFSPSYARSLRSSHSPPCLRYLLTSLWLPPAWHDVTGILSLAYGCIFTHTQKKLCAASEGTSYFPN